MSKVAGFMEFTKANMKMFYRDKQFFFWTFAFPILFMGLLGLAFGNTEDLEFDIGVVDEDGTEMSSGLNLAIQKVEPYATSNYTSLAKASEDLEEGDLMLIIVIPAGYQESLQTAMANGSGNTSGPASNVTQLQVIYSTADIEHSQTALSILEQVVGDVNLQLTQGSEPVNLSVSSANAQNLRFIDYMAPGIVAMSIMMSGVFGMGLFIVSAREKGVLKRLQATPVSPTFLLASRIVLSLMVSFLQAAILIGVAMVIFDVEVVGSLLRLSVVIAVGALVFILLGLVIASFSKTSEAAEGLANFLTMPMMFLGDVFIPLELLPPSIAFIGKLMPLTYFSDAARQIMVEGHTFGSPMTWGTPMADLLLLLVIGLILFVAAVKLFRWE